MRAIYWVAEDLLGSQKGPCCMELVSIIGFNFNVVVLPGARH
jgi:hypothetical protein